MQLELERTTGKVMITHVHVNLSEK